MSAISIPAVRPSISTLAPSVATPDDVLRLEDQGLYELVDGKLIEKKMGYAANLTAGILARVLGNYADKAQAGHVLPEQSFQCFPHAPARIRRPDVAFILASRIPADLPDGHVKILPDIAVEVVSPTDNVLEQDSKLEDYRLAGLPLTWVINPEARLIRVYRPNQPIDELHDGDVLRGSPVLPDFSVNVTDLFPPISKAAVESLGVAL